MEDEELKALTAQFGNVVMQNQLKSWRQQSTMLRGVCKQFWEESGTTFSTFWLAADESIRLALATMAKEDLPPICLGPLLELTCPELVETDILVKIETLEDQKKESKLLILLEKVCKGDENRDHGLRERLPGEASQQGPVMDSLLVVRTCMMLQYMTAISLVWQQLAEEGEES